MASMPDLTPLALHREGNHLKFVLRTPKDILAQLPDNYEQILAQRLANLLADETPLTVEINLAGLAGISSRQLGSLIALERVLRPRFGAVLMTNVSPTIRHVLEVTRTERLFKLS
ncbi:MAG: STAS domain-containing protein [Phycisphaerae bacterium]|nr:STAS domain-containing protein [Phycisphaerae bacterium]